MAEEGRATLVGGGGIRLIRNAGACYVHNLTLSNGEATGIRITRGVSDGVRLLRHMCTCCVHAARSAGVLCALIADPGDATQSRNDMRASQSRTRRGMGCCL